MSQGDIFLPIKIKLKNLLKTVDKLKNSSIVLTYEYERTHDEYDSNNSRTYY